MGANASIQMGVYKFRPCLKYFLSAFCGWFVNAAGLAVDAVPAEKSFPGLISELLGVRTIVFALITHTSAKLTNSRIIDSIHHIPRCVLSQ